MYSRSMKGLESVKDEIIEPEKHNNGALIDGNDVEVLELQSVTENDTPNTTCATVSRDSDTQQDNAPKL